jgi:hypothetical protein
MMLGSVALSLEFMLEVIQELCEAGYGRVLMGAIALPLPVRHMMESRKMEAQKISRSDGR